MDDVSKSLMDEEDEDKQWGPWRRVLKERSEMKRMIIILEKKSWKRRSSSRRGRMNSRRRRGSKSLPYFWKYQG